MPTRSASRLAETASLRKTLSRGRALLRKYWVACTTSRVKSTRLSELPMESGLRMRSQHREVFRDKWTYASVSAVKKGEVSLDMVGWGARERQTAEETTSFKQGGGFI